MRANPDSCDILTENNDDFPINHVERGTVSGENKLTNDFNIIRILRQSGQRGAGSAISTVVIKRDIMVSNPGE